MCRSAGLPFILSILSSQEKQANEEATDNNSNLTFFLREQSKPDPFHLFHEKKANEDA